MWVLGSLVVGLHVLLQLIIFMTNISNKNLRVDYLFTAKIFQKALYFAFPLPRPNYLQNLTLNCKILNVLWT